MPSPSPPFDSRSRVSRAVRNFQENERSPSSALSLPPLDHRSSSMAPPARRRAQPSDRFQRLSAQRVRGGPSVGPTDYEGLVELQEASERLAQTNEDLRTLLERPIDSQSTSRSRPRISRFMEADDSIHSSESQHRRKRRRTDGPTPPNVELLKPVEYGYLGQANPCPLRMEIRHSSTGNMSSNSDILDHANSVDGHYQELSAKHILHDSPHVYVANSRRANIVMQHPDERIFTLERLVIKTPKCSRHDPPLQGLVFVSLDMNEKLERTTYYQIHHFPTSRFGPKSDHNRSHPGSMGMDPSANVSHHQHGSDEQPEQQNRLSADCDQDSGASDSDESTGSRRPTNIVISRDSQAMTSMSDTASDTDADGDSDVPLLPWMRRSQRSNLGQSVMTEDASHADEDSESTPNPHLDMEEDDDDVDNMVAQFDFDEVLRRGVAAAEDRSRRRARTRQRVREHVLRSRAERRLNMDPHEGRQSASALLSELNNLSSRRLEYLDAASQGPLQPLEPPTSISQPPSLPSSQRVRFPDPSPTRHSSRAANPPRASSSHISTRYELLEPSAFFSTERQGRFRYALGPGRSRPTSDTADTSYGYSASTTGSTTISRLRPGVGSVENSYSVKESGGRTSIKFDPPLSARYVLLKLWKSSRGRGARDLENEENDQIELSRVRVEGWCGTRWFPSVEMV